jgi:hypothetical protein
MEGREGQERSNCVKWAHREWHKIRLLSPKIPASKSSTLLFFFLWPMAGLTYLGIALYMLRTTMSLTKCVSHPLFAKLSNNFNNCRLLAMFASSSHRMGSRSGTARKGLDRRLVLDSRILIEALLLTGLRLRVWKWSSMQQIYVYTRNPAAGAKFHNSQKLDNVNDRLPSSL